MNSGSYAAEVLRLHGEGLPNKEIAAKVGCAPNTVHWHLSTRGLLPNRPACIRGHRWTPENTRITTNGARACRTCHRDRNRRDNGWKARPDRSAFQHDYFDRMTPASAYVAGLLAADGCIDSRRDRAWSLTQTGDDGRRHVEWVARQFGHVAGVRASTTVSGKTSWRLNVSSRQHVTALAGIYGIGPRKSLTLAWPEHLPTALVPSFCRGYWDGDGSVGVAVSRRPHLWLSVCSGSDQFLRGMQRELPVSTHFTGAGSRVGTLRCFGERAFDLASWLFADADVYRTRKAKAFDMYLIDYPAPRWLRQRGDVPTR